MRHVASDQTAVTLTIDPASTYDFEVRSMTGGPSTTPATDFKYGPSFAVSDHAPGWPSM